MANWVARFLESNPDRAAWQVHKRARHSLHLRRPDGLIEAQFTGAPMHYHDGIDWRALDTKLIDLGSGRLGAPGIDVSIEADGRVSVGNYSQVTVRLGLYRPSNRNFYAKVSALGSGVIDDNTWKRTVGEFTHQLTLTETGLREEIVIANRPTVSGVQAGDWFVLETIVTGVSFPDGEIAEFTAENKQFPLPVTTDANGKQADCRRFARTTSGVQYIYTGIPVSWLASAVYPVVIDPDFAGGTADGTVEGSNAVYATARGTSTSYFSTYNYMYVGQTPPGAVYSCYRGYLVFDTSAITADATVTQVNLSMVAIYDYSTVDLDVAIAKYDWSGQNPLSDANREAAFDGCLAATLDDSIWRNTNGMAVNTQYTSGNLATAWVNKIGSTYYGLLSAEDKNNSAPVSSEQVGIASASHATAAYRPVLTVLYDVGGGGPVIPVFMNQYRQRWN